MEFESSETGESGRKHVLTYCSGDGPQIAYLFAAGKVKTLGGFSHTLLDTEGNFNWSQMQKQVFLIDLINNATFPQRILPEPSWVMCKCLLQNVSFRKIYYQRVNAD